MPEIPAPEEQQPEERERAEVLPPSGRERLVAALRRPGKGQVVVAVLLAFVGFSAVTQVRVNELDNTYATLRQQDLIDTLNGLSGAEQRADSEIARLEQTKEELETSTGRREAAIAQAQQLTDTLDILAGLVPVTGPGVRLRIEETDQPIDVDTMLDTVQELRNAGAEALELNDTVRVVADTSFAAGVGGIVVDGRLVSPPYVVDVIGEPVALDGGLRFPGGPLEQLDTEHAEVDVRLLDEVQIASVHEQADARYARPDPDAGKPPAGVQ